MTHGSAIGDSALTRRVWGGAVFLGVVTTSAGMLALGASGRGATASSILVMEMPYWLLWAALAPLVVRTVRAIPVHGSHPVRRGIAHLAIAGGVIALHTVALYAIQRGLGMDLRAAVLQGIAVVARWRLASNLLAYGAIIGLVLAQDARAAAHARERLTTQLSSDLASARLDALRLQLNPHFLFNALNAAAMLVRHGHGDQSIRMLAGIGDLLRRALTHTAPEVTLREELDVVDRYLGVECVRFGDRLRVTRDIDAAALDATVPSFLLQPIVENAIHHGIARRTEPSAVTIAARHRDDRVVLEVHNDAPADETALAERGLGIGVRNTVERLARLYGDTFDFRLDHTERGTVACIALPYRTQVAAGRPT